MSRFIASIRIRQSDDHECESDGISDVVITRTGESMREAWQRAYEALGTIPTGYLWPTLGSSVPESEQKEADPSWQR